MRTLQRWEKRKEKYEKMGRIKEERQKIKGKLKLEK
jgi:hypothetical protein